MSVRFEAWLLPEASQLDFQPPPGTLGPIVDLLARHGWTDRNAPCELRDLDTDGSVETVAYQAIGSACDRLASQSRAFHVAFWSTPWPQSGKAIADLDATADFSKADDLVLRPTHGVSITLVLSPDLRLLPADMNGSAVRCPVCGQDMTDVERQYLGSFAFLAPSQCPHCGAPLIHRALSGETASASGALVAEEAPFFRFALCLEPARQPAADGVVRVEPSLVESLREVTGVTLRVLKRWR